MSRIVHTFRRTFRRGGLWLRRAACGTLRGRGGALPWLLFLSSFDFLPNNN